MIPFYTVILSWSLPSRTGTEANHERDNTCYHGSPFLMIKNIVVFPAQCERGIHLTTFNIWLVTRAVTSLVYSRFLTHNIGNLEHVT